MCFQYLFNHVSKDERSEGRASGRTDEHANGRADGLKAGKARTAGPLRGRTSSGGRANASGFTGDETFQNKVRVNFSWVQGVMQASSVMIYYPIL